MAALCHASLAGDAVRYSHHSDAVGWADAGGWGNAVRKKSGRSKVWRLYVILCSLSFNFSGGVKKGTARPKPGCPQLLATSLALLGHRVPILLQRQTEESGPSVFRDLDLPIMREDELRIVRPLIGLRFPDEVAVIGDEVPQL